MSTVWFIITLIVVGLIAGAVARLVVPGTQRMSIAATIVLGIIGSFVAGAIGALISGNGFQFSPAGIIGSIIGAIVVLLIYIAVRRRSA